VFEAQKNQIFLKNIMLKILLQIKSLRFKSYYHLKYFAPLRLTKNNKKSFQNNLKTLKHNSHKVPTGRLSKG